jgi:hypothetical protein
MAIGDPTRQFQGWVLTVSSVIIILCAIVIIVESIRKWMSVLGGTERVVTTET